MLRTTLNKVLILGFIGVFNSGCAYTNKVSLVKDVDIENYVSTVTIIDTRTDDEKSTRMEPGARWYGDHFIEPNKLDYLKYVVSSKIKSNTPVFLKIKKYDTVEYIPGAYQKTMENLGPAAILGPVGVLAYSASKADVGSGNKGDQVVLRLEGDINNKPFSVLKMFSYSDLGYMNFPVENEQYSVRLKALMDEAVNEILFVYNKKS